MNAQSQQASGISVSSKRAIAEDCIGIIGDYYSSLGKQ
jgi:hypothetical protein